MRSPELFRMCQGGRKDLRRDGSLALQLQLLLHRVEDQFKQQSQALLPAVHPAQAEEGHSLS